MTRAFLTEHYSGNHSVFLDLIRVLTGPLQNKTVLDIGCDYSCALVRELAFKHNTLEAIGVNPVFEPFAMKANIRLESQDAAYLDFPDAYFDLIISSSAFEHVKNLKEVLIESWRVLKPGGYLYSHFGPIWSGAYGHHLWTQIGTQTYTYHNLKLPPFCHLRMNFLEIMEYCITKLGLSQDVAQKIAEYVLFSNEQNQLMFEDYQTLIFDSPFEVIQFNGYGGNSDLSNEYFSKCNPETFLELRKKYPRCHSFMYDGIQCLLYKPTHYVSSTNSHPVQDSLFKREHKINFFRLPDLYPVNKSNAQLAILPNYLAVDEIRPEYFKNVSEVWAHSKSQSHLISEVISDDTTIRIVPPTFKLMSHINDSKIEVDFDRSSLYYLACVLETSSQQEWKNILSQLAQKIEDKNTIAIILVTNTNEDIEWIQNIPGIEILEINIIESAPDSFDEINTLLNQHADAVICPNLNMETISNPYVLKSMSNYQPLLVIELDSKLKALELSSSNMLRAFNLFRFLTHKMPELKLVQLNHRFIKEWNQQQFDYARSLLN